MFRVRRNDSSAFDGEFRVSYTHNLLELVWINGEASAQLTVDFADFDAVIRMVSAEETTAFSLSSLL